MLSGRLINENFVKNAAEDVVEADGKMNNDAAIAQIRNLRHDEGGGIRMNALQTLAALNAKSEVSAMKKCLIDEKPYVRKEAAKILETWS